MNLLTSLVAVLVCLDIVGFFFLVAFSKGLRREISRMRSRRLKFDDDVEPPTTAIAEFVIKIPRPEWSEEEGMKLRLSYTGDYCFERYDDRSNLSRNYSLNYLLSHREHYSITRLLIKGVEIDFEQGT